MRKLVALNTIMGMEEIEKLDILQEYQKRLPQYDIVENKHFSKKVKDVTPEQRDEIIKRTARDYCTYASWYK